MAQVSKNLEEYNQNKLLHLYANAKIHENGCWEWIKGKDKNGYGITSYGSLKETGFYRKIWKAHRLIYYLLKGAIPEGYFVCHSCDFPSCININHIFLGTAKDNSQDREKKKRGKGNYKNGEKNPGSKLTQKDVLLIRKLYSEGIYASEIAKNFQISSNHVIRLVAKARWKHI